jgi:alpha/beta superfamily hydrolase
VGAVLWLAHEPRLAQPTDPARHHERLLIVDFGSQVTQLIARRLRELNVYCEIHPFQNVTDAFLAEFAPKAVIFSGGPASVIDEGSPRPRKASSSWACRSWASATASR